MKDDQQRENLFSVLKQVLKNRGFNYADIALALNTSEITIKRLFKEKDCKMSRLIEICDIIGISLSDLLSLQERMSQSAQYLPRETERELAKQPKLFIFLLLLVSWVDLKRIAQECQLTENEIYLLLRQLEKLGIIELQPNNKIKYIESLPIRWRLNGPLSEHIKQANMKYISHCIDKEAQPNYEFSAASRLMTESSAAKIQESLRQVKRDFEYLATQDQMFYPAKDLQLSKLVVAMGPFPILKIFPF